MTQCWDQDDAICILLAVTTFHGGEKTGLIRLSSRKIVGPSNDFMQHSHFLTPQNESCVPCSESVMLYVCHALKVIKKGPLKRERYYLNSIGSSMALPWLCISVTALAMQAVKHRPSDSWSYIQDLSVSSTIRKKGLPFYVFSSHTNNSVNKKGEKWCLHSLEVREPFKNPLQDSSLGRFHLLMCQSIIYHSVGENNYETLYQGEL